MFVIEGLLGFHFISEWEHSLKLEEILISFSREAVVEMPYFVNAHLLGFFNCYLFLKVNLLG